VPPLRMQPLRQGDLVSARKKVTCGDCGAKEGELHDPGCDHECCPFCGGQLVSCGCCYTQLGFDYQPKEWDPAANDLVGHPTAGLPESVYKKGLTPELNQRWKGILAEKGRVPYICFPSICGRCGDLRPELFMVSDAIWEKYIPIREREKILCLSCFRKIVRLVDGDKGVLRLLTNIRRSKTIAGRMRNRRVFP